MGPSGIIRGTHNRRNIAAGRHDRPGVPTLGRPPNKLVAADGFACSMLLISGFEARFPSAAVEKEFAQATGRADTTGKTDREAFHAVLSQGANRYLVRQLCWVFTVQGLETYILRPRDPADFDLLVETLGSPDPISWISCVIGVRGSIAPPELCNGLMVPIIAFDQIYSFDSGTLIKAIPKPEKIPAKEFGHAAQELFWRIMHMTDNAGATD